MTDTVTRLIHENETLRKALRLVQGNRRAFEGRMRDALGGYRDSDLVSLATTMRARLEWFEEGVREFVWEPEPVSDSPVTVRLSWTEGVSEATGEPIMVRYADVWWDRGSELHGVSITYQREQGLGLYQWPQFVELEKARAFASLLMRLEPEDAQLIHGAHWNGVVL
jgi:hypothetical protein